MGTLEVRLENGKQKKTYTNGSFTLFLNDSLLLREDFLSLSVLFSFKLWAPVGFRRQADSGFSIAEPSVLRVKSINFTDLGMFIAFQK